MLLNESLFMDEIESPKTNSKWTLVRSKSVRDTDGFMTDYTWYTDGDEHVCIFGDTELYTPDNTEPDVDGYFGEAGAEAMAHWFNNYVGPGDDEDDLEEDFSASMPSWLTRHIHKNKRVQDALRRRAFDLSNLEFVKLSRDQIPTKSTDPIFKDETKQLVYLLRDEKRNIVYLPGVGDDSGDIDVFLERDNLTKSTKLKYLSIKQLISITVLMGYIENSDSNKNIELRKQRSNLKKDMWIRGEGQHQTEYTRYPENEDGSRDWDHPYKEYQWVLTKGQDKSGYKLNPTKYKDMLDQADMHTYGRQFDRYSKKLELLRSAIIEYITSMDVKKGMSTSWGTTISRVMREFEDALNEFKNIQTRIEDIIENPELDDESKNRRISHIFDGEYGWNGVATLRSHLENAWKYLKEVKETIQEKLTSNNFAEFKKIADEIGLTTAKDLERFKKEEVDWENGEDELTAIKRYKQELIDAGIDLSQLVNEKLDTDGASSFDVEFFAKDIHDHFQGKYDVDIVDGYKIHIKDVTKDLTSEVENAKYVKANNLEADNQRMEDGSYVYMLKRKLVRELEEGAVKDVATEMDHAGGKYTYVQILENHIEALNDELHYLTKYAVREIGKGGAFDSQEEIDEAVNEIESQIRKLESKLKLVRK